MKKLISFMLAAIIALPIFAQDFEPKDYLPKEFHKGRREAMRKLMPENSVAIVFANPERNYANDVDYPYHQNPDMYYFTGYKEPDGILFIFKETQKGEDGKSYNELLFVQKRNPQAESWNGKRIGVEGAKNKLGIENSYNSDEFKNFPLDLTKFSKLLYRLPDQLPIPANENANLGGLVASFFKKANINQTTPVDRTYMTITGQLRAIKTPEELVMLRKAVEISTNAQVEVMKAAHTNMSELEIQGLHEYVHKIYGAEAVGYGSIIGSGENGCILHYVTNTKTKVGNSLILMDVGAEYHGYTADVTRTIPANGKFSPEERAIYQIVYDAQEAAFKTLKDGSKFSEASAAASKVIADGLIKLGIIKEAREVRKYYTHGLGHHIGLDVHDRGGMATLAENMVITIEPGIYIPANSEADKKWWGIGVRIEDDILITKTGYENLSIGAPRKIEDIEKLMSAKSPLDNFKLPALKSASKN